MNEMNEDFGEKKKEKSSVQFFFVSKHEQFIPQKVKEFK